MAEIPSRPFLFTKLSILDILKSEFVSWVPHESFLNLLLNTNNMELNSIEFTKHYYKIIL